MFRDARCISLGHAINFSEVYTKTPRSIVFLDHKRTCPFNTSKFNQYLSGGRILVPVLIRVLDAIGLAG